MEPVRAGSVGKKEQHRSRTAPITNSEKTMTADEVYEYADELQYALEDTVSSIMGTRNQIKPLIDKVKGRRITEDDLYVIAQDADDLADMLKETAEDMQGAAREIERAHLDLDDEEEGSGRLFGLL